MDLSVIIPISSSEDLLPGLLSDLKKFPLIEIILVGENELKISNCPKIRFIKSPLGRAIQLNKGANEACGKFLWFLHADSRVTHKDFKIFYNSILFYPDDLHYLNLNFYPSNLNLNINKFGAKFRSDFFKLPFGDQGFAISRENFLKVGEFPPVPLGEDLIWIWNARKNGLKIRNCGAEIYTSSRKYLNNGWIKTTLIHLFYTFKLIFPLIFKRKTI